MGWVVEGGLPDVDPTQPQVATAGPQDATEPTPTPAPQTPTAAQKKRKRRSLGAGLFRLLKRVWIPLVILAVFAGGGFTVSRLHGVWGSEKRIPYSDTKQADTKPFNPKYLRYEIWGPAGTTAQISFFNGNGDPENLTGVPLPWSLEFPISTTASIGSVAAQGDGDSIGCRITVDGKVESEKEVHAVSAFTSCVLKAA